MKLNKVMFIGRLTHDPVMKYLDDKKRVCNYRIAVPRKYNFKEADFFNCIAWNSNADFVCRYFSKGRMIAVSGRMEISAYETKNGEKRIDPRVIIEEQDFCGDKPKAEAGEDLYEVTDAEESFYEVTDAEDDDLPF